MYTVIWRFRVRRDAVDEFLEHYRAGGTWARLFARASGYLGTELYRSVESDLVFVVMDRWRSRAEHDDFRGHFAREYGELDRACKAFTEEEERLGDLETF